MDNIASALPVIFSLVIMEGLLSVDNALLLAAMVSHLGEREQKRALRLGYIGAFVLRIVALLFVSILINNAWLRLLGAGYLIYLMCKNLGGQQAEKSSPDSKAAKPSFWATVAGLLLADLSFSIDNVIAAVAISPVFWVVLTGVFIGMATMLLVSGTFVKLMQKYPALEKASYLLVGYVGLQLLAHEFLHFEASSLAKLATIVLIVLGTLVYARSAVLKRVFGPLVRGLGYAMGMVAAVIDLLFAPLKALARRLLSRGDKG